MKKKFIGFSGVLLMLSMFLLSCYADIIGIVVDDETGEPIEGAVIMAEWTKTKGLGLTYTKSYRVVEVVTDKEGSTKISGIPAFDSLSPFIDLGSVAVYKKGYVLWSNNHTFPGTKHHTDFKWRNNYVFRLERFKPEYSYLKHTSFIGRAISSGLGDKKLLSEASYWENLEASKERDKRRIEENKKDISNE